MEILKLEKIKSNKKSLNLKTKQNKKILTLKKNRKFVQ